MADYDTSEMNRNGAVSLRILAFGADVPMAALGQWRVIKGEGDLPTLLQQTRPDILLLPAAEVGPELAGLLASGPFAQLPLVLLARDEDAEAVGLLMERPFRLVSMPVEPAALSAMLAEAAAAIETGVADSGSRYDADERLAALKRDADRIADALAELSGMRGADSARPVTAARIRAHIKARRNRERFFAAELFTDPVWDILLDLGAARLEERPVSVSSLCIAAQVPTTTALRTIKMLVDRGMLRRRSDPADARRSFIQLSPQTAKTLDACLEAVLNQPGQ